jgi:hypothetical protein
MNLLEKGKLIIDKDIVSVEVSFINFDGEKCRGVLEVHKDVRYEVVNIFKEIEEIGFPIFKMETIDKYGYDDERSVVDNNSSAYNFRFVSGSTKLSDHAIGLAIDINPKQNPWMHPSAFNKFPYILGEKGTIEVGSDIVNIFNKWGWSWGGNWKNPDYQHFFRGGDLNKNIKNKLYSDLGIENPYFKKVPKGRIDRFKDFIKRIIR